MELERERSCCRLTARETDAVPSFLYPPVRLIHRRPSYRRYSIIAAAKRVQLIAATPRVAGTPLDGATGCRMLVIDEGSLPRSSISDRPRPRVNAVNCSRPPSYGSQARKSPRYDGRSKSSLALVRMSSSSAQPVAHPLQVPYKRANRLRHWPNTAQNLTSLLTGVLDARSLDESDRSWSSSTTQRNLVLDVSLCDWIPRQRVNRASYRRFLRARESSGKDSSPVLDRWLGFGTALLGPPGCWDTHFRLFPPLCGVAWLIWSNRGGIISDRYRVCLVTQSSNTFLTCFGSEGQVSGSRWNQEWRHDLYANMGRD